MYAAFENTTVVTRTMTSIRMFLDDPNTPTGEFKNYVTVILEGTMEVLTQPQALTVWEDFGPVFLLPWSVGDMPSTGESTLGTITQTGNPNLLTTGVIRQNVPGQAFPATLEASVYQVINVPGYGNLHNKAPIVVSGVVDSIPPFHTTAKCANALLFDENDRIVGLAGGRSLTLLGPA